MNKNKILKINGTTLDQEQLKNHLEKIATNHNLVNKSQKKLIRYRTIKRILNYKRSI